MVLSYPRASTLCMSPLWHAQHTDCRLSKSKNSLRSPLCGFRWCTTALRRWSLPACRCAIAAVMASVFIACQCLTPLCLPIFGAVKRAVCLCFYTAKIMLQMYTYVFVDLGCFALILWAMLHSNEILTWKSLTGITDDLYLGLALGTTLAIITFAGMAFTYFLSVKLSD